MKLWDTASVAHDPIKSATEKFTVGDDWFIDQKLVRWDCYGSLAHATMLHSIGILSAEELTAATVGFKNILALAAEGKFEIKPSDEDCHTAIENYLTQHCGEVGKKVHTARSRNDQILTVTKLFMKAALLNIGALTVTLAEKLHAFAAQYPIAFPGYTHMQKGMPSTVQLWAAAHAESLLDDCRLLKGAFEFIDSSPLGSAAGYGVTFPINRELSAELLGFSRVQRNVITAQNSRGKNEAVVLSALATLMRDLGSFNADLLFFSQREVGYLTLPERFCTGSSIMPQKRNPDVLELLRAKVKVVASLHAQVLSVASDLPSGYNRDYQLTKRPLFEAIDTVEASLTILAALTENLAVNKEQCEAALEPELFAADMANELVKQGKSFRDAYREVKSALATLSISDPYKFIRQKTHTGAPGNPGLKQLADEIAQEKNFFIAQDSRFETTLSNLMPA